MAQCFECIRHDTRHAAVLPLLDGAATERALSGRAMRCVKPGAPTPSRSRAERCVQAG
ncbi:BLUF domain-containing protein [Piscinibacter defluvii]|uniref:BLUF domain-containing protein n=1 Tax=Piscinibacter defluvii TaxID=1796922 RepID=UPI0013E30597|nr:BLUF domain-containing protein [Piscinibacter defluvii]